MNSLTYRKGTIDDLKQIMHITTHAFGQFRNILSDSNNKSWEVYAREETYLELFDKATCFVCVDGKNIVGSAFLIPHGNEYKWFSADWSYIRLVAVKSEYEGNGIGRKLTTLCVDYAKESGERVVALHTSQFQHAARHIYESMGFEKQREFELFEKKYWVYTLKLNGD